jgi:hypothetical protein
MHRLSSSGIIRVHANRQTQPAVHNLGRQSSIEQSAIGDRQPAMDGLLDREDEEVGLFQIVVGGREVVEALDGDD